jgi:hypothetical protein
LPYRTHDTAAAASPPTVSAALAIASRGFKRSTPPTSSPFRPSSSAHTQPLLLHALCRHQPPHPSPPSIAPLRPLLCPTVTSSSSTPRRCTSMTFPTLAPTAPLTPHHRSSPLDARHCGAPSPVRFPSLRAPNQTPREPNIVLGYIPRLPVPPVHRIPAGATAVRHEPNPPLFLAMGRKARRAEIVVGPQWFRPL